MAIIELLTLSTYAIPGDRFEEDDGHVKITATSGSEGTSIHLVSTDGKPVVLSGDFVFNANGIRTGSNLTGSAANVLRSFEQHLADNPNSTPTG